MRGQADGSALGVEFTSSELVVTLMDGRRIAAPLDWYPRLAAASPKQRANYEIMPMGIHWPDLDEDLSVTEWLEVVRRSKPRADKELVSV